MPSMGGRFYSAMLHDDIQDVNRRVDRMHDALELLQAEVQELATQVSDVLTRLDAVEISANPAKAAIERMAKQPKKSVEKD